MNEESGFVSPILFRTSKILPLLPPKNSFPKLLIVLIFSFFDYAHHLYIGYAPVNS